MTVVDKYGYAPPTFPSFFVVGVQRSGTTLARAIITGHPELEVPPETGFLPRLIKLRRLWWRENRLRQNVFIRLVFANGRLRRAGIEPSDLSNLLSTRPPATDVEAMSRIYELMAGRTTRSIGDKTPGYLVHLDLLASVFPSAQFMHMIRHPLNVVASLRRQPWGPDDPLAAAWLWLRGHRAAASALVDQARLLTVRLEDLISDPEPTASRMVEHLGVALHADMLKFSNRADRIRRENIEPAGHLGLSQPLSATRDWSKDLSSREAADVWSLVGREAGELGYEGPAVQLGRVSETEAARRLARFERSRAWRRAHMLLRIARP